MGGGRGTRRQHCVPPWLDVKPVVDLLVGIESMRDAERCVRPLEGLGYEHRGEAGVPGRHFFRRFREGRRAYHLHVAELGGEFWDEHLLFRHYLRVHSGVAGEYARLKHELAARVGDDRAAYTAAKERFVGGVLERAEGSRKVGRPLWYIGFGKGEAFQRG